MPQFDQETRKRRLEALRLARVSSAMEGLKTLPEDDAALDAFALGDIDEAEFLRQVSQPTPTSKHRQGVYE